MSKACIDRSDSLIFQHKRRPRVIGFTYASSEVHFRSTESQTFYWSIMTADDSIKCRCANSGMTGLEGGFQNPGVCLQAFPSFSSPPPPCSPPHPLPSPGGICICRDGGRSGLNGRQKRRKNGYYTRRD